LVSLYKEFEKIGKSCDREKLKNLRLIKEFNGVLMPTNALAIVFGKLDNVMIKCARFKGTIMEYFIDKKEFTGTLFEILEESIKFLQNHLHLSATIEGLRRVEEYEIPFVALREIVLNAIIHRDYTRNSDIKIAIYDDIVEIISVGGLVNGLTIEEVSNGRSELRNKVVANLFKELLLQGSIKNILHDNEKGKNGFLTSSQKDYYFVIPRDSKLIDSIIKGCKVEFKVISLDDNKERAKILKVID